MSAKIRKKEVLGFHEGPPRGKIEVIPTKPLRSQHDLALAYSPGVAVPCLEITDNKQNAYKYTSKGNLVGVISIGTAVLGLGDIGPEASKPVMEGKGVLFKKFAGIDVFDIEVNEKDPDTFIKIVKSLEPTFGGINLEDIKAPECFKIEKALRKLMSIPVMHDDQHGTAIISSAALLNALELVDKKIEDIKIVISGGGAAAIACADLYVSMGVHVKNIVMTDSNGVVRLDRDFIDEQKAKYATNKNLNTLGEALMGADMFLGLSKANILTPEMILTMAVNPIIFALSNPDPEISYELAMSCRKDIIMATGRSDHPNQVNNVLGFPYIFRGALDVRATTINEAMKLAAVKAIADLAKESVPDLVLKAYGSNTLKFGRNYLIPKPLDPRLITTICPAVAKAAMDSNVAQINIENWRQYKIELQERVGIDQRLISRIITRAKKDPKRVIYGEAHEVSILKAAQQVIDQRVAIPILLGNRKLIQQLIRENELDLGKCEIIDPIEQEAKRQEYAAQLFKLRQRKGMTHVQAMKFMLNVNYFGVMMVNNCEADAFISGISNDYPETIRPALEIIGPEPGIDRVAGMYILSNKNGNYFLSDTTVNLNPSSDQLVDIIGLTAQAVRFFDVEPRIAGLSYSNFGSAKGEIPKKMSKAVAKAQVKWPELLIDGEIQANVALNKEQIKENYPFSKLSGTFANTLIFPNLESGNIAYKLLMEFGGAEAIGPILMGMRKAIHVLQKRSSVSDIFNITAIAVVDAQEQEISERAASD